MKNPVASPIAGTLIVVAGYMLARSVVYFLLPATSIEAWFVRDSFMSIPRLAAFGALIFSNRRWHSSRFDWRLKDFGRALLLGGILVAIYVFYYSGSTGPKFPGFIRGGLLLTTIPVALFEEYAFRGPLLTRLCQRISPWLGVLASSAVFAVYHFQAQPFSHWGEIFLIGVILSNLRVKGLSLGWLAVIHYVVDVVCIFFGYWLPEITSRIGIVYQVALLVYALGSFPYRRRQIRILV